MAWFRVDDRIFSDPAWIQCSHAARALWVSGGAYAVAYSTDGVVPKAVIRTLGGQPRHARELVERGLWSEFDGDGVTWLAGWKFTRLCSFDYGDNRATIPTKLRKAVIDRDGLVCGLCGGEVEADDVHLDHIIPVSHGGGNSIANLQVAHSTCNIRKGNRA